ALVVGVIAGALVIPPVLDLLQHAYGFLGAPGANPATALPAPQAGLISALAQGVIQNNIDWSLIGLGAGIGVALIVLDAVLASTTKSVRLPPLAVGLGMYLPTSTTLMVVVGALVGAWFDKRAERGPKAEPTKQLGVLVAALVAFTGKPMPLALVGSGFDTAAIWIGGIVFAGSVVVMYRWIA